MNNDDVVSPGSGFETHPHRDMEIVTWVLRGQLVHQDSEGHNGLIYPGLAQRMSAGTGILHSEKNDSWRLTGGDEHKDPVHFVQMWVLPDENGIEPGYEQLDIDDELLRGGLVPVASGLPRHDGAPAIRSASATPRCSPPGWRRAESVALPGRAVRAPVRRRAARSSSRAPARSAPATRRGSPAASGQRVTATEDAEVLVWEMHAAPLLAAFRQSATFAHAADPRQPAGRRRAAPATW